MEAFIFDMDGVIIDSEPVHNKVVKEVLLQDGVVVSDEEFQKFTGMTSSAVFQHFITKHNLPYTAEQMTHHHMNTFKNYVVEHNLQPIDGIVPLLHQLQDAQIPMAIASSSPMNVIEFVTKTFNIDKYFQFLVSGEDLPHSKPAPDIYLKTAKKLAVEPQNCVVLEDSKNGSIAAKTAGMYCIGFKNPNSGNQDLSIADIIVNQITEINIANL